MTATITKRISPITMQADATEILTRLFEVQIQGKAEVFYTLSGHCSHLDVKVYAPFWESKTEAAYHSNIYMRGINATKVMVEFKADLLRFLDSL